MTNPTNTSIAAWLTDLINLSEFDSEAAADFFKLNFTEQILTVMEEKELSRVDLARIMGCSKAYVSTLFSGRKNLTIESLMKLAFAVDKRLDFKLRDPIAQKNVANRPDWEDFLSSMREINESLVSVSEQPEAQRSSDTPVQVVNHDYALAA